MRRAIAFAELLKHPNLVRMMGTWESDDIIFVGERHTPRNLGPLTGRVKQLIVASDQERSRMPYAVLVWLQHSKPFSRMAACM